MSFRILSDEIPLCIRTGVAFLAALMLWAGVAHANEATEFDEPFPWSVSLSSGFDYTRGDYGTSEDTETLYLPVTLGIETGPFITKLTVPYLWSGGGSVIGGGDDAIIIGDDGVNLGKNWGLGDVVTSLTYVFYPNLTALPIVELTSRVKWATGDEDKGLSTGKNDYSLQLDVSKSFGRLTPFAGFGYRFLGTSAILDLNGVAFASGGLGVRITDRLSAGAVYDWQQAATSTTTDSHGISPYASYRVTKHISMNPYGVVGLSESAPDYGVGLQFAFRFGSTVY
jgi:hypothetical protein